MVDISAIAGNITAAIGIAKELIHADHALDKAELKYKLAEIMSQLATAKSDAVEIHSEKLRLERDLSDATKKLAFAGSMQYTAPYYINVGAGDKGPYCGTCWDAERLAIHLIERQRGFWYCKKCDEHVEDSTAEEPRNLEPDI